MGQVPQLLKIDFGWLQADLHLEHARAPADDLLRPVLRQIAEAAVGCVDCDRIRRGRREPPTQRDAGHKAISGSQSRAFGSPVPAGPRDKSSLAAASQRRAHKCPRVSRGESIGGLLGSKESSRVGAVGLPTIDGARAQDAWRSAQNCAIASAVSTVFSQCGRPRVGAMRTACQLSRPATKPGNRSKETLGSRS